MVQIGSGVGSAIGQRLGFSREHLRALVGAGTAAGIAASFNAPIAGAIFALEIVLGEFGVRTFTPIVFASVMGTMTARALIAGGAEVVHASYSLVSGMEIFPYAALGIFSGMLSIAYIWTMEKVEHLFGAPGHGAARGIRARIRALPPLMKPALGGLGVGLLGLLTPRVLGTGYDTMNAALHGELAGGVLAAVCLAKIVATSLTLGTGAQGGSFFPATFIGATGGGAFGALVHWLWPARLGARGAYALVGMGAVVAGATQGPLTGIVMLFELTSDYQIILPLMVSCILATSLVQLVMGGSLYTRKLKEKGIVMRRGHDMAVMRALTVREAMVQKLETLRRDATFHEVLRLLGSSAQPAFPVVDGDGRLVGVLSLSDVRGTLGEADALQGLARADDICTRQVVTAFPDDDLELALERIETRDLEALVVVDPEEPSRVVGLVTRRNILAAYEQAVRKAGLAEAA